MSFSKVDVYTNDLEKVGKVEYEICADSFHIEVEHPLPSILSDYVVAEEEHALRISYPQQFIQSRPIPGNRRVRVTIEMLEGSD